MLQGEGVSLMTNEQSQSGGGVVAREAERDCPIRKPWVRRIGAAAFVFFLVKGLLWLAVPAALVVWRSMAE